MKYAFGVMAVIAVGVGIYYLMSKKNGISKDESIKTKKDTISNTNEQVNSIISEDILSSEINRFDTKRAESTDSIVSRHKEAAKIIEESLHNIMSDDKQTIVSENKEDLEEMSDALDKLLDE